MSLYLILSFAKTNIVSQVFAVVYSWYVRAVAEKMYALETFHYSHGVHLVKMSTGDKCVLDILHEIDILFWWNTLHLKFIALHTAITTHNEVFSYANFSHVI